MLLRETADIRVVARKGRVVEIDKATGIERICGEVEADRHWDHFERHGNGLPKAKKKGDDDGDAGGA